MEIEKIKKELTDKGWRNITFYLDKTIKACRGRKEIGYFELTEQGIVELKEIKNA